MSSPDPPAPPDVADGAIAPEGGSSGAAVDEVMAEAERAFDRGDWRSAGELARRELDSPDPRRRRAAEEMRARFTPDPELLALYCGALLSFGLTLWTYLRR